MKTLNAAATLRGAETGSFTTIDLITCRPETGEAAFFKYGAAPSYVKKGHCPADHRRDPAGGSAGRRLRM